MQLLYSVLYIFIIARSGIPHTSFQFILLFHLEKFIYDSIIQLYFVLCSTWWEPWRTVWPPWSRRDILTHMTSCWNASTERSMDNSKRYKVPYFSVYQPHIILHSELALIGVCDWYTAKKKNPWKSAWIRGCDPYTILANCPYLIGTVPILIQEKVGKRSDLTTCPYFCTNLSVLMYTKFRNVPIFEDFSPICPYFLGFRVGKYAYTL